MHFFYLFTSFLAHYPVYFFHLAVQGLHQTAEIHVMIHLQTAVIETLSDQSSKHQDVLTHPDQRKIFLSIIF